MSRLPLLISRSGPHSTIRAACLSVLALVLAPLAPPALGQTRPADQEFLPVSVWYSGGKARAPMLSEITDASAQQWRRDLEQIRQLGFNTVRTWVEWAHCEPRPGQFHFENLELLCGLAEQVGLRVIVQVYADSAPDWVGREHPDAEFVAQSGEKVPSQAAPGYCTDSPQVGQLVARFYTEAARVASRHRSLYGWDLWSEPHIVNWAIIDYVPNAQFCFCPHTRQRFREWLLKRYGSVEGINRAWYRNFESLGEVDPPRFGTILSYTDFIDWKTFLYEKLAADLRMRYDAVRRGDPAHVITSHAAVPSLFGSPFNGDGPSDDFLMADQVDYYGTSLYPKHSNPKTHWPQWQLNAAMDFSRSANLAHGGFYVGELQAGFGVRGVVVGDPITPADHRVWMWALLARGAKAINLYAYYPMSSGYESGGYGLIELDGKVTARAQAAGQTAHIIETNKQLILSSRAPAAQIGLVYNPLAQMIGGEQHSGPPGGLRDSLIGYYRALAEAAIPVDFVHRRALESDPQQLRQYKLLILPYPVMLSAESARGLKDFIASGGRVLAEARLAWNDQTGSAAPVVPGMGLAEVFGVREARVRMAETVAIHLTSERHPATTALEGQTLTGAYFAEGFEMIGDRARTLGTLADGSACLVASTHGSGEALIVGSFLGLGTHPVQRATNRQFIRNLADWARVDRPITVSPLDGPEPPLEVYLRRADAADLLFLVNPADAPQSRTVRMQLPAGEYDMAELLSGRTRRASGDRDGIDVAAQLPAGSVELWTVRRRG